MSGPLLTLLAMPKPFEGHIGIIHRNEFGTPLLNDLMQHAKEVSKSPMLGYVNCDIILLQEFQDSAYPRRCR
jgi:hypothetical protein